MLSNFYILLCTFFPLLMQTNDTLIDFKCGIGPRKWQIVDDVVMGGRSDSDFNINDEGYGEFSGVVSLENNGGFSSVRFYLDKTDVTDFEQLVLRIKGDKKTYQLRIKDFRNQEYSYSYKFSTLGDWEEVIIPFNDLIPTYRGRVLDLPNFNGTQIEELSFLIGNNKAETFKLQIAYIALEP